MPDDTLERTRYAPDYLSPRLRIENVTESDNRADLAIVLYPPDWKIHAVTYPGFTCLFIPTIYLDVAADTTMSPQTFLDENGRPFVQDFFTAAHEFGHFLGLDHPGGRGNDLANYLADRTALMGMGSEFRPFYFEKWKEYIDQEMRAFGPWTIERPFFINPQDEARIRRRLLDDLIHPRPRWNDMPIERINKLDIGRNPGMPFLPP